MIYPASSAAKKATARATSSLCPKRPMGMDFRRASRAASGSTAVISVSIKPGATRFTVTLRLASSLAMDLLMPMSPALLAA